jgi:hypothetical protein
MSGFFFFVIFFGVVLFIAIVSNRQLKQKRAAMQAQIDELRGQMQAFADKSCSLDEKTQERVGVARASVEAKLHQASGLLKAATKDRHFDRIGRILALVETKLSNVQDSLGRAQTRADERAQRQAENAQRREAERAQRTGSYGQKAAPGSGRRGSFAPPAQVTGASTPWNTIPPRERGACFFCSRPCLLRELTPVIVPIGGINRRVLACPADFARAQSGAMPPIRSFVQNGRHVPWYAYHPYNPYTAYYGDGIDFYIDLFPYDVFEPGFLDFDSPYGYDDGQPYIFSPDTEAYQDYASGLAAGEAMGAIQNAEGVTGGADNSGSADFPGMESANDFVGDSAGDFDGVETAGADVS